MKERVLLGRWKHDRAHQKFRAAEAALWRERWPQPPEARDVDTHLGPTRTYCWTGAGSAEAPIVFLHGAGGTSLAWSQYVEHVGGRVALAIDTIGEVGCSVQNVPLTGAVDLATWLDDVLASSAIERAHLVGMSYGGFIALNQAARRPDRVCSLTLLDPAGIVPIRLASFLRWGIGSMAASKLPRSLRRRAAHRLRMPAIEDPRIMGMAMTAARGHETRLVRPEPLSDDQLRSITMPVLLMLGDRSEAFDVDDCAQRADACFPNVEVHTVAGAGHALPISHPDEILRAMNPFLDRAERPGL